MLHLFYRKKKKTIGQLQHITFTFMSRILWRVSKNWRKRYNHDNHSLNFALLAVKQQKNRLPPEVMLTYVGTYYGDNLCFFALFYTLHIKQQNG